MAARTVSELRAALPDADDLLVRLPRGADATRTVLEVDGAGLTLVHEDGLPRWVAATDRVWVEQAKGVLAATQGTDPEAAFPVTTSPMSATGSSTNAIGRPVTRPDKRPASRHPTVLWRQAGMSRGATYGRAAARTGA